MPSKAPRQLDRVLFILFSEFRLEGSSFCVRIALWYGRVFGGISELQPRNYELDHC